MGTPPHFIPGGDHEIQGLLRHPGRSKKATVDDIKKAYRKLARKYHPDVSKEKGAEEKFKDVSEAYQTLKDSEKRAAYDQLGSYRPGEEVQPPPEWHTQYGDGATGFSFDDIDLSDLFGGLGGGFARSGGFRAGGRGARAKIPIPGQDFEVSVHLTLDEAYRGTEVKLELAAPEYDADGFAKRVPRNFTARIPKGAADGQRLRIAGKGGKGINGGRDGDLYLNIVLHPHPLYRVTGHDVYLDLPLAPWEAVLGTSIDVPTPGGAVRLKVPPGAHAGQQLRLPKRGLPKPGGEHGDLYAMVQIVVPTVLSEREQALFKELAEGSRFNPRGHFEQEVAHGR
ncbi:MAG TPA: DnaJ C-terminal domain-containing protein [Burkholderiaceae bacterium]|nr:DnaJ C-terminal domain-containing protein [Burkholderiaceae bacterium]